MDAAHFHQVVPRPSTVGPGPAPRWIETGRRDVVSVAAIRAWFSARQRTASRAVPAKAGVLVPILERPSGASVLLTRRAATMRSEPLTISFPGGRCEPGERPEDAALRESEEEIGLDRTEVEVLGTLDLVHRRRDQAVVLPVVGLVRNDFVARANPTEVDAVLEVPFAVLLEDGAAWSETWGAGVDEREVRFFAHEDALGRDLVWGLTAKILWELIESLVAASASVDVP